MNNEQTVRQYLKDVLSWQEAHINFERTVKDLPKEYRGMRPDGFPYSIWQLVEHIRIAQWDILDFSRNPGYTEHTWPDDFWPEKEAPANDGEWERSLKAIRDDREAFRNLLDNHEFDLLKPFDHGTGQTLFRQALLIADHTAYHVGQIILIRKYLDNRIL